LFSIGLASFAYTSPSQDSEAQSDVFETSRLCPEKVHP
jgi:hypothetical protein